MFTNTTGATQCVTIDTNTACTGTNFIFTVLTWELRSGTSAPTGLGIQAQPESGSVVDVEVPAGQTLVVVVSEVTPMQVAQVTP